MSMRGLPQDCTIATLTPNSVPVVLIVAHVLSMLGFATYAALLPELRDLWGMSNAQAGVVGGTFFAGYIATVSYWTALTDRVDGRKVYLAGSVLATAGAAGFGLLAQGFASALAFQALIGAGIAATYMPGLRLLSDRISGANQSRYIAFYTSFFAIGTALSLAAAGLIAPIAGWRMAFIVCAAGPLAAGAMVWFMIDARTPAARAATALSLATLFPLAAWRRVLANRAAAGYTLGYCFHCVELFGSRAWMVAFLVFSSGLHAGATFPWSPAVMAAVVSVLSVPASIVGNEVALRIGRRPWILIAMVGSGTGGIVLGLGAGWHWALVLGLLVAYAMLVMADSATLTAGLVAAAPESERGAALGLYSIAGFGGGLAGPVVFGAALDLAGGGGSIAAWAIAYAAIGAGCLVSPLVGRISRPR